MLAALFVGVGPIVSKMGAEASHDIRQNVSDDSSAEDEQEIMRHHSRIMKQ